MHVALVSVLALAVLSTGCDKKSPPASGDEAPAPASAATPVAKAPSAEPVAKTPPAAPVAKTPPAAPAAFLGAWKLVAVTTSKGPVPQSKLDQGGLKWVFREGGAMLIEVSAAGQTKSSHGSWRIDGDLIRMDESGQKNAVTWKRTGETLRLTNHPKGTPKLDFEKVPDTSAP